MRKASFQGNRRPADAECRARGGRPALVIKVVWAGGGWQIKVGTAFCLLTACLVLLAGVAARSWLGTLAAMESAEVQRLELEKRLLEEENRQVRLALFRKERERRQMALVAQVRVQELWAELRRRNGEMRQLWKEVGKSPESSRPPLRRRHSLSGSRSGRLLSYRIMLDLRRLRSALARDRVSQRRLAADVAAYREEKRRQAWLAALEATPSIYPVDGTVCSGFGYRVHPLYGVTRMHSGVDLRAPYGTPIRAAAAGRVVHSGYRSGYGLCIVIDHGNGLKTLYGHCSSLAVGRGTLVRKGRVIAYVGNSGVSTGPHLHYEVVRRGTPVDPASYLAGKEAPLPVANRD